MCHLVRRTPCTSSCCSPCMCASQVRSCVFSLCMMCMCVCVYLLCECLCECVCVFTLHSMSCVHVQGKRQLLLRAMALIGRRLASKAQTLQLTLGAAVCWACCRYVRADAFLKCTVLCQSPSVPPQLHSENHHPASLLKP